MFGQSMATFIPPMLAGTVLFIHGYNPHDIVRHIKARRISVLVSVPKILDVLREHILRVAPDAAEMPPAGEHFLRRWWRYRAVHRAFGWKFWSFVVGAAPLDPALEEVWGRLGFAVIQGYGLTETAPIVSLNHPFSTSKGSVGKAIAGVEVRIAPDGEILVRGDNVTTGYFNRDAATRRAFEGGWFHTGDIGEARRAGPAVHQGPEEGDDRHARGVERLPRGRGARRCRPRRRARRRRGRARGRASEERVHAVVVLDPGIDPTGHRPAGQPRDCSTIRRFAGSRCGRRASCRGRRARASCGAESCTTGWPPARRHGRRRRTPHRSRRSSRSSPVAARSPSTTTLDELGLSSLERVELMAALEEKFGSTIDESAFANAEDLGDAGAASSRQSPSTSRGGRRDRRLPVLEPVAGRPASLRRARLPTWILPLARLFAWIKVDGLSTSRTLDGPVVFAANHQSHMDAPAILWALPAALALSRRHRHGQGVLQGSLLPAEYGRRRLGTNSLNYYLAALFFNAFPLPQREAGARQTLRYMGELLSGRLVGADLPGGQAVRHRRDWPFPARHRDDWRRASKSPSCRSG